MMASMFSGVSGLRNNLVKMNVIGNNIANVNTVGFKAGRVTFREALVQNYKAAGRPSAISGGTNPVQLGLGMQVSTIDNLFQQGGLETTGQITDLAIQGSGFFILSDGTGRYYTRNGAFGFDANSTLVDPATGMFVQGRMADASGNIPSSAVTDNIVLPFGQQDPARQTTVITLGNNLDSNATESEATLISSGTTNINSVSGGFADNGAGGTHNLVVSGNQATNSSFTGTAVDGTGTPIGPLSGNMTLASLGVTIFDDLTLSIDNGTVVSQVLGLTGDSTIDDLINNISQISGITAQLVGGEIQITRDYAGNGVDYNVVSSASVDGNIVNRIFGIDPSVPGTTFTANNGTDHTFTCVDTFTPTVGTDIVENLTITVNENTGLANGIEGLGGNIALTTLGQLAAGTAVVETADTTHAMSMTIYDSQGGKHALQLTFLKSPTMNTWSWTASFNDDEIITGGGSGWVRFDEYGALLEFTYNGGATALSFDPNNGAADMSVNIDAGTTGQYDGLTGFSKENTAAILNQDGYSVGILDKIAIDKAGNIIGIFTNGVSRVLAQVLLADFNNVGGLLKAGRSLYQASANSGDAIEGIAGETISGEISSGALEASSVDIAYEFTNMITAQRGFQSNARVITTSDQMLDELVNLKR